MAGLSLQAKDLTLTYATARCWGLMGRASQQKPRRALCVTYSRSSLLASCPWATARWCVLPHVLVKCSTSCCLRKLCCARPSKIYIFQQLLPHACLQVGCEISGFATGVMFTEQKSARLHGCSLGGRRLGAACGWPGPGLPSIRSCYVQKPLWPDEHCFTCTDPVASAEQALGRPPVGQAVVGPEAAAAPGVDPSPACDCSTAAGAMQSPAAGAAGSAPVAGGRQGKGPTQASCGGAMSSSSGSGSKGINEEHDHGR